MNSDGTNQVNLTNNPAADDVPSWSPDGTKIAFRSYRDGNLEIYVMNPDGTNQTRLTNNPAHDGQPSWLPDGTKIAFQSYRDGNGEIYIMNPDGTDQTRLTTSSPADSLEADWSPLFESIDIKPGSFPNSINLKSKGVIPVAILSSDEFDATTVVSSTVRFGPAKAAPVHGNEHIEDVNGDSLLDWVGHFNTQETGLSAGDIQASILGRTPGSFFCGTDSVVIVQPKAAPALGALTFSIGQNFRNPFNPDTWIPYTLAMDVDVVIEIYDASGKLVRALDLGKKRAGAYLTKENAAYWDGKDNLGQTVASGVYFYTLKAGSFQATRKMFVLK
jgi:TolB protein